MYDVKKLIKRIEYCENAVNNIGYDPSVGTTEKEIFCLCSDFLDDLDKIYDKFTENSKKILFS